MKYFFCLLVFLTTYSFGQTVLWQDTFSDPNVWTIESAPSYQGQWDIGVNSDVPDATSVMGEMASSTHSNGFAFFDAAQFYLNGSPDIQDSWIEMTNSIDLSAHQDVLLRFEQRYKPFYDETFIEMSTDGGVSWVDATDVNEGMAANASTVQNTIYHKFTVNNSNDVKFRFRWTCNGSAAYGWMIDDVNVMTVPDNDISTRSLLVETDEIKYKQIPEQQVAPINFSVLAKNMGNNVQYDVEFIAEETTSGYLESSNTTALLQDEEDSLFINNPFTPTGLGNYNVEFSIQSEFTDDIPQNNEMEDYSFDVTEYIYAVDNGVETDDFTGNSNIPFEGGNIFKIYENQVLSGIDGYFHSSMNDNNELVVTARLYELDQNDQFTLLEESIPYTVQPGDAGSFKTFPLQSPAELTAGNSYLVTVGAESNELVLSYSEEPSPQGKTYVYGDFGGGNIDWFFTLNTLMVRMNFDPCITEFNNIDMNITDTYCPGSCDGIAQDNETNLGLYEYNWYDNNNNLIHTGSELTDVCAGDYSVTKEDQCGNSDQVNFTIEESVIEGGHSFDNLLASSCNSNDGEIVLSIDYVNPNPSSDITIDVSGPTNETINTVQNSTYSIPNVLPGDYTITVTDNENGCDPMVFTTTVEYTEIEQPLCVVTVDSSNTDQNIVVWEKPSDISLIDSFYVHREITTNNYQKIGAVHVDSLSQFIDTSANPNTTAYRYKVSILNVCGDEEGLSPFHNTIHLQFQGNGNFNWNHYQIENETDIIDSYNFYRDDESDGNWEVIQVVSGNQNTFTDPDFSDFPDASYFVDVNWSDANLTCQATKAQDYNSSRSNKYNTESDPNLSVETNDDSNAVGIRPNPTSDNLFIDNLQQKSNVKIISSVGKIVFDSQVSVQNKIDVSNLKTGVYIIQIKTNKEMIQKRFVKK